MQDLEDEDVEDEVCLVQILKMKTILKTKTSLKMKFVYARL